MITDFRDFCLVCYVLIDDLYQQLAPIIGLKPGPKAECSDSELITMAIAGECREWNKETTLLANWQLFPDLFPVLPTRTRFNRRRRNLAQVINLIRQALLRLLEVASDKQCVIDSLPIPVIGFHLVPRSRNDWKAYGADYGRISSKKQTIFGYKLHLLVTFGGVITDFELTAANADDRHVGLELLERHHNLDVLADKAYISGPIAQTLAHYNEVKLVTLPKSNQKKQVSAAQQWLHNHFRQIVETVNGQLTEQFNIEENYAHGFWGLVSRLYTKLTAHTLCLYLNQLLGKANILQIRGLAFPELI
jgi:DDE family transposase